MREIWPPIRAPRETAGLMCADTDFVYLGYLIYTNITITSADVSGVVDNTHRSNGKPRTQDQGAISGSKTVQGAISGSIPDNGLVEATRGPTPDDDQ